MKTLLLSLIAVITFKLSFAQTPSAYEQYKTEIQNQLNKAYSVLTATINGITYTPLEKMPLYNIQKSDQDNYLIEVNTLRTTIGIPYNQAKFQAKNINIYNLSTGSVQVKYDFVTTIIGNNTSGSKSLHIDMIAKEINGIWKFDASKFFANKNKVANTEEDRLIDSRLLTDPKQTASQVVTIIETNSNNSDTISTDESNCYLFFYHKRMYVIQNGAVINVWHMTTAHQVDELTIYDTKEGEQIDLDFTDIYVDYKSGKRIQYGCEPPDLPLGKIFIRPQFLK